MARYLVCGSIAYDNIMEFPGVFKEHIIAEKLNSINVSFLVDKFQKLRGGTAPNISYNLALVGEEPLVFGSVGCDFEEYRRWLVENGVKTEYISVVENDYTANCFITTDQEFNQITTFYPGAMSKDIDLSIKDIEYRNIDMIVIAPTDPSAMSKWSNECVEIGLSYMYDPGMQIPRLSKNDLINGIMGSKISIFNEYEFDMMNKKTNLTKDDILNKVDTLIITKGSKGSELYNNKESVVVGPAKTTKVVDPTGAGDAYRAGLLKGYSENVSLDEMGKYASISAVYAVEYKGATIHKYSLSEMNKRYNENYGEKIKVTI